MTNYNTEYRKAYTTLPLNRIRSCRNTPVRNPIQDSFKEYLRLDSYDGPLKFSEVRVSDYIEETFKKQYPHLAKRYFEKELNELDLENYDHAAKLTVYDVDYNNLDRLEEKSERKYRFDLDPMQLPPSTYKASYRLPTSIEATALHRRTKIVQPGHFGDQKLLEKMKVEFGESTYTEEYGKLGAEIIENQLLGKITHLLGT